MRGVSFTKEKLLPFYARINEDGVPRIFTFLNSDGTAHPISAYDFKIRVKEREFSTTNLFELSVGSGLTVQGASLNQLRIAPTVANLTQKIGTNFWTLFADADNNTWLNGPFYFHNGKFDGLDSQTQTIYVGGSNDVTITISQDAGTTEINAWASVNSLPNNVSAGYWIKFTSDCVVSYLGGTVLYPAGSIAVSFAKNDGSAANWYPLARG